jgi:hypothetical protein
MLKCFTLKVFFSLFSGFLFLCLFLMSIPFAIVRFFFIIHLFTCAYIVWIISPSCPVPHTLGPEIQLTNISQGTKK